MSDRSDSQNDLTGDANHFLSIRWWDYEKTQSIASQSWFENLREKLSKTVKLKLNIGVFEIESDPSGVQTPKHSPFETVRDTFRKVEPSSVHELRNAESFLNRDDTQTPIFQPSLVVAQGYLEPVIDLKRYAQQTIAHAARELGMSTKPTDNYDDSRIENFIMQINQNLNGIYNTLFKGSRDRSVFAWMEDIENVRKFPHLGEHFIEARLMPQIGDFDESIRESIVVGFPMKAFDQISENKRTLVRIIGSLEHRADGNLFVRAIALANMHAFR